MKIDLDVQKILHLVIEKASPNQGGICFLIGKGFFICFHAFGFLLAYSSFDFPSTVFTPMGWPSMPKTKPSVSKS